MTLKKSTTPRKPRTAKAPNDGAAPARKAATRRKAAMGPQVFIDYPQEGETVQPGSYTIRIGTTPMAVSAEISIDGGPWLPCREAAGYFWYDWGGYESGPHQISVRAQGESPVPATTERYFSVALEAQSAAGQSS